MAEEAYCQYLLSFSNCSALGQAMTANLSHDVKRSRVCVQASTPGLPS